MSEHTWTLENLASYLAGGLDAAERERLEQHTASCAACGQALQEVRATDQALETLFASIRPEPALEDRMIHALRLASMNRPWSIPLAVRLAVGAAAVLLVGVLGTFLNRTIEAGTLVFPGSMRTDEEGKTVASNNLRALWFAPPFSEPQAVEGVLLSDSGSNPDQSLGRAGGGGRATDLRSGLGSNPDRSLGEGEAKPVDGLSATHVETPGQPPGAPPAPNLPPSSGEKDQAGAGSSSNFRGPGGWGSFGGFSPNGRAPFTGRGGFPAPPAPPTPGKDTAKVGAPRRPVTVQSLPELGVLSISGNNPQDINEIEKLIESAKTSQKQPPSSQTGTEAGKKPEDQKPNVPVPEPAVPRKIVIRSGELEFEIESFDTAVATVRKLVDAIAGAFIATVNSEKLPNGKVRGAVTLRVPPERLDTLVENLRRELSKTGELKRQRLGSQDITKQYTDLESRLRAARTMEERLLQIIKAGKGEIKDLLQAEKELGVWRTKIEEFEGELRYYNNLVALSTLTLTLYEKEIRAAAAVTEIERVQMGIEVEEVDQAQQTVLAAVAAAKGRVLKSELKQHAAGQLNAILQFEVAPEAAGPLRDRLRQLGQVTRLEIDRLQQTEGGSGQLLDGKTKRAATQFSLSLYNLANIQPRETATLQVATRDVPAGYRLLQEALVKAQGRVFNAQLNEQDKQNITAQLDFEIRRAEEALIEGTLARIGDVYSRNVVRAPESENVTDRKVRLQVKLVNQAQLPPRETIVLGLEVAHVDTTTAFLTALVRESQGRTVESQVAHERSGRVTARLVFDVPLGRAAELVDRFKGTGTVRVQQASRNPQAPESALAVGRLEVTLSNVELIVPTDEGLWPQIRRGLYTSFVALSWSVTVVIVGVCFVLPWVVVCYGIYRLVLRLRRRPRNASTPA